MPPKKKVSGLIKLQIQAGQANPAPPVGPALGAHGVNIMEFCKAYNAATEAEDASGSQAAAEGRWPAERIRRPPHPESGQGDHGSGPGNRPDQDGRPQR